MTPSPKKSRSGHSGLLSLAGALLALAPAPATRAAVPGITGPSFALQASADYTSQPDGASIYSWGYGCTAAPAGFAPFSGTCQAGRMQLPGPTLIVTEGDTVVVTLTNNLPAAAGNASIVFPGFRVTASGADAVDGILTKEAPTGKAVTYTFVAATPGTRAYYSGTQPEIQIEMGLFGAIVVLPRTPPAACVKGSFSLSSAAYGSPDACYDREYMFQLSEMDSRIHDAVRAQVLACPVAPTNGSCPQIQVATEPYRPNYYLVNGRSMPDDMDTSYAPNYPRQPYNANPHMHPGEKVLMRIIGQGRWQHPFHFHGNHARVLARDGNLIVSAVDGTSLAGPLLFTTPSVPGQAQDQIFTWTGQGLNWDAWGPTPHTCNTKPLPSKPGDPSAQSAGFDPVTHEYCPDHGKPIPVTPPDPTIVAIGQWYGGTPYLGIQTTTSAFNATNEPPGTLNQNPQAGYAYMWHSHNEREITTNDVFPGGMMVMLLIDPPVWFIDEKL